MSFTYSCMCTRIAFVTFKEAESAQLALNAPDEKLVLDDRFIITKIVTIMIIESIHWVLCWLGSCVRQNQRSQRDRKQSRRWRRRGRAIMLKRKRLKKIPFLYQLSMTGQMRKCVIIVCMYCMQYTKMSCLATCL